MGAGRKQAMRRASRRARLAQRRTELTRDRAADEAGAPAQRKPPNPILATIGILIAVAFVLLLDGFLLHNQIEIARVMTTGRPAQATVRSVRCEAGAKASVGGVTVTFTDLQGATHTVAHSSDIFDCYKGYAPGDVITIRYVPSDPAELLTGQEIAGLPFALTLYGLGDFFFIIAPIGLLGWLLWERGALWLRRGDRG